MMKDGGVGFLAPRSIYNLILVYLDVGAGLYHESQKQPKTKTGQDFIAQNICSLETEGEKVPECLLGGDVVLIEDRWD